MKKTEVKIINGMVTVDKNKCYYQVAERISNDIFCDVLEGDYDAEISRKMVQIIIDGLAHNSIQLKGDILTDISYCFTLHGGSSEKVRLPFKEAKAYVDGYNDATRSFKQAFEHVERSIKESLDKFLE